MYSEPLLRASLAHGGRFLMMGCTLAAQRVFPGAMVALGYAGMRPSGHGAAPLQAGPYAVILIRMPSGQLVSEPTR